MSSDAIKVALQNAFPNLDAQGWKRRTKKSSEGFTVREFEHPHFGRIATYETTDGKITVGGNPPAVAAQAPAVVAQASASPAPTPPAPVAPTQAPEAPQAQLSGETVKMRMTGFPSFDDKTKAPAEVMERITPVLPAITDFPVKVGERISISAGKSIYEISFRGGIGKVQFAQRGITAKCSGFVTDLCQDWLLLADEHLCDDIIKHLSRPHDIHNIFGWVSQFYNEHNSPELIAALEAAKLNVEQKFANGFALVTWGDAPSKGVLVSDITIAAVQKVAAPKKKVVSLRSQMVVNSKWRFSEDVQVTRFKRNPEFHRLMGLRNSAKTSEDRLFYQKLIDSTDKNLTVDCGVIPSGTILTVKDKIVSEQDYSWSPDTSVGLVVPCSLEPEPKLDDAHTYKSRSLGCHYLISYRQIADAITAEEVPEKIVYALRDSITGQFFGGWIVDNSAYPAIHTPRMVDVFSSAKKYKTSAAAKASIRDFTGYNDGLDTEAPYWVAGGPKKIDLPDTWEMVEIDQTTATVKQVIEIQKWFKNTMRLRVLAVEHGSVVRTLFEKAERKNNKSINAIVFAQNFDHYTDGKGEKKKSLSPFSDNSCGRVPSKLGMIHAAGEGIHGDKVRVKLTSCVGYACERGEAILFKLAINDPDLEVTIIDIDSLEEIVNDQ